MKDVEPIRMGKKREGHCHKLVAETAKQMAGAVYEEMARKNNEWYSQNPDMRAYVDRSWGFFVEDARRVLANMLGQRTISESEKENIYEALILDKSLVRGRGSRLQIRGLN